MRPIRASGLDPGQLSRVAVGLHFINVGEARKRHAMDVMFPGRLDLAATFHGDPQNGAIEVDSATLLLCCNCFAQAGSVAAVWERRSKEAAVAADPRA